MKRKFILVYSLFAAMMLGACSENNDPSSEENQKGAKSKLVVKLNFEGVTGKGGSGQTRAQSTAIPTTSWDNIKQVQFLLYDAGTNAITFSAIATPQTGTTSFTYPDVPAGNYKLVAVANAISSTDNIVTSLDGGTTAEVWDEWNVRQKNATNLVMSHKQGAFPTFSLPALATAGNTAYSEPAEIFMGSVDVTISAGTTANPTIGLKREVSMMRVRLNVKEGDNGVDNTRVDFTEDASILVYRLPKNMGVLAGNNGGVSATSVVNNVLSIYGSDTFKTTDPASGYSGTILGGNFTMWRDLIVFPNNGGRANNGVASGDKADAARQYFIVVSGKGPVGHKLANGTILDAPTTVYWSGTIKENFVPNVIREANLTLRTGGSAEVPTVPVDYGDLTIVVSEPAAWDSNIVESSVIM